MTRWEDIARSDAGDDYATAYAERFRRLADDGVDVHGEATFVTSLWPPPARVLDAGCGTGRIAVRLAELGHGVVGFDVDASMVEVARREAPTLDWRVADLASVDLGEQFDVVLLAGNVVPLLEPGTLAMAWRRLAAHAAPGGRVVCGFGTDAEHLPAGCPPTPVADVVGAAAAAGLTEDARWAGWDGAAAEEADGYVVLSFRLAG
ncbi:methyltransferase domain-containing protein [Nocardioides sp. C4-1]|uniref:class I SAM-dependent methyltransferase n=1 Tax=Nocardioides sp. C4-1 TaxID=3151851 RepID=UPI003264B4BE